MCVPSLYRFTLAGKPTASSSFLQAKDLVASFTPFTIILCLVGKTGFRKRNPLSPSFVFHIHIKVDQKDKKEAHKKMYVVRVTEYSVALSSVLENIWTFL